jgi:hypothetical protein
MIGMMNFDRYGAIMIKLKYILSELWMPGALTTGDDKLRSYTESTIANKDWIVSRGVNDWYNKKARIVACITECDKPVRMWVEVSTKWLRKPNDSHSGHHERVGKMIEKVSRAWSSEAKRLRNDPIISEIGNKKIRSWKECFQQALRSPKVAPFIVECGTEETSVDPVNFTPRV